MIYNPKYFGGKGSDVYNLRIKMGPKVGWIHRWLEGRKDSGGYMSVH